MVVNMSEHVAIALFTMFWMLVGVLLGYSFGIADKARRKKS